MMNQLLRSLSGGPLTLLVSWAFVLVGGALAVVFYIRSRPTGAPPEQTPRPAQPRIVTTGSISSSQPQSNSAPPRTGEASSLRTEGTIRRLITINVLGTLLIETNPESLSTNGATVIPAAVHALRPLLARNEVFLVVRVVDDIGEIAVRGALEHAGVLGVGSERVASHRLLFCETMEGAVAIVRQLEPGVHIDTDSLTMTELARFIPRVIGVSKRNQGFREGSIATGTGGNRVENVASLIEAVACCS